ncbi:MAG: electron transfer flavoprotein subunit beta/FixA family protein [Desulfitobacteriaceae bacterium]|nr:electron transfer flavoprotein subunit beta/FixA family protein [Desulfitobacteriaceae bacterium]
MLNIVVLVKQVPNTTQVKIDPVTNNLVREGVPSIVNPYDMYAIEEALLLKEKFGGKVSILSMGPAQAKEVIKYAMAMGADDGILLSDRAFAGSDTLATSYTLSAALSKMGKADLVLCGKQAADGDTAQVPAELAEYLGMGCITYVSKICDIADGKITVERTLDFAEAKAEVSMPAVLTLNKGINEPRLPRLKDMVKAMYMSIQVLKSNDLTLDEKRISLSGSPTQVMKVFSPERKKSGYVLNGSSDEQVSALVGELIKREII